MFLFFFKPPTHLILGSLLIINFLSNLFALRLSEFKAALLKAFSSAHAQTLPLTTVKESVKRDKAFRDEEIESALQVMQDANQIMVADDNVFLIWKHLWVTSNERCTKAVVNCVFYKTFLNIDLWRSFSCQ